MMHARSLGPGRRKVRVAAVAMAVLAAALAPLAQAAGTLDRIKASGRIALGYRADARPFSYKDDAGRPAGYSVALCLKVADQVKAELGIPALAVDWVPVTVDDRFQAVRDGKVDLLCGAETATLARRKDVSFSIPTFPGGIGAIVRSDASFRLKEVLSQQKRSSILWRASPAQILEKQTFSIVKGSTSEAWLADRIRQLQIPATVVPVASYDEGIRRVLDRSTTVFFGDRAILVDAWRRNPSAADLQVLDRRFSDEAQALALPRGDEDYRLAVDRALSRFFASDGFREVFAKSFGQLTDPVRTFFLLSSLPE